METKLTLKLDKLAIETAKEYDEERSRSNGKIETYWY
jgi:hypothetical protein